MARVTVHNPTGMPIFVGSTMIPAGDSRDFDEQNVPEHLLPPAPAPAEAPPEAAAGEIGLAAMAKRPAKELLEMLPAMRAEHLAELEAIENAGAQRKTLLAAIAERRLALAADAAVAGT